MKRPPLYITIPTPCHERWSDMTPTDQGAFCHSCQKPVVDFIGMTDQEVISYFTNHKNICGRFREDQINTKISTEVIANGRFKWRAMLLSAVSFLSLKSTAAHAAPDQFRIDISASDIKLSPAALDNAPQKPLALITETEEKHLNLETDTTITLSEVPVYSWGRRIMGFAQSFHELPQPSDRGHVARRGHDTQFLSPKKERRHWLRRFLRLE